MIYFINYLFLNLLKVLFKLGINLNLRERIFSSQRILERNFKIKSDFSFIQIGANDGVSFDFLYDFVVKRNSSGIVVEPIKEYFDELVINYKNFPKIIKINKAIHPSENEVNIYRISPKAMDKYPEWVKGIASFDATHHIKLNIESKDIIEEKVSSDSLMIIINNNIHKKNIDYLQIDTEGFDYEILKMINFKVLKPSMIKFESVNLPPKDKDGSHLLLKEKGYYLFNEFGDTIGINLHKIRLY